MVDWVEGFSATPRLTSVASVIGTRIPSSRTWHCQRELWPRTMPAVLTTYITQMAAARCCPSLRAVALGGRASAPPWMPTDRLDLALFVHPAARRRQCCAPTSESWRWCRCVAALGRVSARMLQALGGGRPLLKFFFDAFVCVGRAG